MQTQTSSSQSLDSENQVSTSTPGGVEAVPQVVIGEKNAERVLKIHSYNQIPVRLDEYTPKAVSAFLDYLASLNAGLMAYDFKVLVNPYILVSINQLRQLESLDELTDTDFRPGKLEQTRSWLMWSLREVKDAMATEIVAPEIREFEAMKFHYEVENPAILQSFVINYNRITMGISPEKLAQAGRVPHVMVKKLLKKFSETARRNQAVQMMALCDELKNHIDELDTFDKFLKKIMELKKSYYETLTKAMSLGYSPLYNRPAWRKQADIVQDFHRLKGEFHKRFVQDGDEFVPKRPRFDRMNETKVKSTGENPGKPHSSLNCCTGCGRFHRGGATQCNLKAHPNFNKSGNPWKDSRMGKCWAEKGSLKLPVNRAFVNGVEMPWSTSSSKLASPNEESKGECINCMQISKHVNDFDVIHAEWKLSSSMGIPMITLLDTGCMKANLVANDFIERFRNTLMKHGVVLQTCESRVCTIHSCSPITEKVALAVSFCNPRTKVNETISIEALVVQNLPVDLIIGLDAIRKYKLASKLEEFFQDLPAKETLESMKDEVVIPKHLDYFHTWHEVELPVSIQSAPTSLPHTEVAATISVRETMGKIGETQAAHLVQDSLDVEQDNDEIEIMPVDDIRELNHRLKVDHNDLDDIHIYGSDELQARLRMLCMEFRHIFSTHLNKEPALIKPLSLDVDSSKWYTRVNQGPPRPQSFKKLRDLQQDLKDLLDMGVIRLSKSPYYSQVLLVPKPDNTWRLCIDYRRLNDATAKTVWPLPKIVDILGRIGENRSTLFCKMDATKGYYQAPLLESARQFTAFTTAQGIYEWTRVPMGVASAPAHFHRQLAEEVLSNLLYRQVELYMDDILVHAKTEEELLMQLRLVFTRLSEFNVTLNPKKCFFGMAKVEFLGHVIDEDGISMSEEKIDKVKTFQKPQTGRTLRSFIGLANYFRDHIANLSWILKPLYTASQNVKKYARIRWTNEMEMAFNQVKDAIASCPKLYHLDGDLPLVLQTDACDYGIGAYLFQLKETERGNKEQLPIFFISKALSGPQLRWSTAEKEAYAIFYALSKLEPWLLDRVFQQETDHANLTFHSMKGSNKVLRWKLWLQQFQFHVKHIPGKENVVADMLSRAPVVNNEGDQEAFLLAFNYDECVSPHFSSLIGQCHSDMAGHHGVELTLSKIRRLLETMRGQDNIQQQHVEVQQAVQDNKWPFMRNHVKRFVRSCAVCQKHSERHVPEVRTERFTVNALQPMELVSIDTMGPFQESKQGYCFVVVIIDCFTRFVELYPSRSTSAMEAATCSINFAGRYGIPERLRSDNGSQFVNGIIRSLLDSWSVQHELTMPYSSEENGISERVNKEVLKHLVNFLFENDKTLDEWECYLPMVQRIINSTKHEAFGASPAQLVFGNRMTGYSKCSKIKINCLLWLVRFKKHYQQRIKLLKNGSSRRFKI